MLTESEVKLQRYSRTEKEADEIGRIITVRQLRPSEQMHISGITPEFSGSEETKKEDGEVVTLPRRGPFLLAAMVCAIDDNPIPFPRSRGELNAIMDRLDTEGLTAAGRAVARLIGDQLTETIDKDIAKNS